MDVNSTRGRGRGRGSRLDIAEPTVLRRPHIQGPHSMNPATLYSHEHEVNPVTINPETKDLQELLRTSSNAISTGMQGSNSNYIQVSNISNPGFPYSSPIINTQGSLPQPGGTFNKIFTMNDSRTCQSVPQLQAALPLNIQSSVPQNIPSSIFQSVPTSIVPNVTLSNIPNLSLSTIHDSVSPNISNQVASHFARSNMPATAPVQENYPVSTQLPQYFAALSMGNVPDVIRRSNLSVDAPEFVPKAPSFSQNSHPNSYGTSNSGSRIKPEMNSQIGEQSLPPHAIPQMEYFNNPIIVQVNNAVVNLTLKPHRFEQIAKQLTAILSQVKDINLMREIITVIFEQGVGEANFRYNGARLCQFLNIHITYSYNGPSFRELLFKRCSEEFNCKDFYLKHNCSRLCGFALFLAEIFSHVVSANSHYFETLQVGVCDVLVMLMTKPTNDNLRCVAKVLKGTGHALESCGPKAMDNVMVMVKDVAMTAPVGVDVRSLLLSIIELRAANWGRAPNDPGKPGLANEHPLGTVYYGANGDILKVVTDENEESESDTDEWPTPEEDDEVLKYYEDFLQSQINPSKDS